MLANVRCVYAYCGRNEATARLVDAGAKSAVRAERKRIAAAAEAERATGAVQTPERHRRTLASIKGSAVALPEYPS